MSAQTITAPDATDATTLAGWVSRHHANGIASATLDPPDHNGGPGSPWTIAVDVREHPEGAAYLMMREPAGWTAYCYASDETLGVGLGLLDALRLIRPDVAAMPA